MSISRRYRSIKFKNIDGGIETKNAIEKEVSFVADSDNIEIGENGLPIISGEFTTYKQFSDVNGSIDYLSCLIEHGGYQYLAVDKPSTSKIQIYRRNDEYANFSLIGEVSSPDGELYNFFSFNGKLFIYASFGGDIWLKQSDDNGATWSNTNYGGTGYHWVIPPSKGPNGKYYVYYDQIEYGFSTRSVVLHIATTEDCSNFSEICSPIESIYDTISLLFLNNEIYFFQCKRQIAGDNLNVQKYRLVKLIEKESRFDVIKYFACGPGPNAKVFNNEIVFFQPRADDIMIHFFDGFTWESKKIEKLSASGNGPYIELVTDNRLYFLDGTKIHFIDKKRAFIKNAYSVYLSADYMLQDDMLEWHGEIFFTFWDDTHEIIRVYFADRYNIISTATITYPKINKGEIIPVMAIIRHESLGSEAHVELKKKIDNGSFVLLGETTGLAEGFEVKRIKFPVGTKCDLIQFQSILHPSTDAENDLNDLEIEFLYKESNLEHSK